MFQKMTPGNEKWEGSVRARERGSRRREIYPEPLRNPGPVPGGNPFAGCHEPPDLLEHLGDTVRVAQASVAPDCLDGGAHALLLGGAEAGGSDQEAGEEEERLARVAGSEGFQDRQRLVHGDGDAWVDVGGEPDRWRRIGSGARSRS